MSSPVDTTAIEQVVRRETRENQAVARLVQALSAVAVLAVLGIDSVATRGEGRILSGIDWGIHVAGYTLTKLWSPLLNAVAGSALEILVPLGIAIYLLAVREQPLWGAVFLGWAAESSRHVASYIAQAPGARFGWWDSGTTLHEWAFILYGRAIEHAAPLAATLELFAWLMLGTAFVLALEVALDALTAWRQATASSTLGDLWLCLRPTRSRNLRPPAPLRPAPLRPVLARVRQSSHMTVRFR
jgi:hypothetical protein